jgi:hypothetical protein
MRYKVPCLAAAAVVIAAAGMLLAFPVSAPAYGSGQACIRDQCFSVNVSVTLYQLEQGLMGVSHMGNQSGMLFVMPSEGIWPFWMKNTEMSLDIIWIDNSTIVFMAKDAAPCSYICRLITPDRPATYVLEINGGTADRLGFSVGDAVTGY